MEFIELQKLVLDQAEKKGFGTKPEQVDVAEKIALIHSEISEAFDAYRHQNMDGKDGFAEELGDAMQRIIHLAGVFEIDLEKEINQKIGKNKNRNWEWTKLNEKHS